MDYHHRGSIVKKCKRKGYKSGENMVNTSLCINIIYLSVSTSTFTVIHFENGRHGSSGLLLIRTMSPKPKTMSPHFILGRNIKQAG